jgi:hypothetical protein
MKLASILVAALAAAALAGCYANGGPGSGTATSGGDVVVTPGAGQAASGKSLAPSINFEMRPASIKLGQTSAAVWTTSGATSCQATGAWSGALSVNNPRGATIGPMKTAGTFTYGMSCTGAGGTTAVNTSLGVGAVPAPTIQLTLTPSGMTPGNAVLITWSTTNADSCTATGGTGADGWSGSQAVANATGFRTRVINTVGEYNYDLTCTGTGGTTEQSALLNVSTAAPAAAPTVSFAAQPTVIQPGQATSLTWTTNNATSCAASGGSGADAWSGAEPTSSGGTSSGPVAVAGVYSYTLTCAGPGGSTAQSVTVVVSASPQPPSVAVSIQATPASIVAGQTAALTWSSTHADTCTASGSWSGSEPLVGNAVSTGTLTAPGNTPTNYSYTLLCSGAGGSASGTASVTVNPAPAAVTNFAASPPAISTGQTTTLTWATSAATSCAASGGSGADGWGGAVAVNSSGTSVGPLNAAGTYVYSLICTGPGGTGAPQSVSVQVNPITSPPASVTSFSAAPSTIQVGQSTYLTWSTNSATACTAGGGVGSAWAGAVGTSGTAFNTGAINSVGSYILTLSCTGPGGAGSPSSVVVNVASATPPATTINAFTATPSTIEVGQSANLAWSTSGASTCAATGGTGSDGWAGAQPTFSTGTSIGPITTAGSYTYTLNCSGSGGASGPSSVIVNVNSVPPPAASITSFSASPTSLVVGQSTALAWSSSSATSCTASGGSGRDNWTGSVPTSSTGMTVGPINTAGNFKYTLTCTGPGGSSAPSSVAVDVASAPPVPTISSFTASPTAIQTGQSISLAWSSSGATACVASGGTGADGWSGAEPVSSSGTPAGPINAMGSETYTLTCSGAGGTSAPSSVSVTVTATPPAASIGSFTATPSALQSGGSTSLAWTTSNATNCTAGGGSGSDGWGGPVATSSSGTSTGALTTGSSSSTTYTYTLTCSGPGGSSPTSSAVVTVTNAPPAASVTSFVATPSAVTVGQSTQLSWSTSAATSCTASGGTGTDGWNGSKPVSSSGTSVGPLNTAGTYVYTLTCTGAGGTSAPASSGVTVTAPVPASIQSFTATPSSLTAGQSASLSWTSSAATSCTASGGTGSDGWSGLKSPSSTGTSTGPLTTVGTVTYTLTCTGAGGTSAPRSTSVTVNPVMPVQPTVTLLADGSTSATVVTGGTVTLSWSSSNATSCTASGGSASDWSGTKATASSGVSVGPVSGTPGIYAYTLSCSGPGGSGTSTVQLTIMPPNGSDCGVGVPTTNLVGPEASATGSVNGGIGGLLCLGCSVSNPGYLTDASPQTYATMIQPVGVLGTTSLTVNGSILYPAGRKVGFVLTEGNGLLTASLLQGVTVETLMGNTVQESATIGGLLNLDALGLIAVNPNAGFATFTTTKPFNSLAIVAGSVASVIATYNVYDACVSLQ